MLKKIVLVLALAMVLVVSFCSASFADILPVPEMKLSVEQSPLAIYPPIMIYTAQLSFVPTTTATKIVVDFYNGSAISPTTYEYMGSAAVDPKTGTAVFSKQMKAGVYTAVAKTVINGQIISSNTVMYKVP